jgi:excisionase family DNA binding protein
MTPAEVAKVFSVDAKTVSRWARSGKVPCIRTLGGHRRYDREMIEGLLTNGYDTDRKGAA